MLVAGRNFDRQSERWFTFKLANAVHGKANAPPSVSRLVTNQALRVGPIQRGNAAEHHSHRRTEPKAIGY
jgi:hypothetical protein